MIELDENTRKLFYANDGWDGRNIWELNSTKHLNGLFVTSIYDENKREVTVVNDRYGSKNYSIL